MTPAEHPKDRNASKKPGEMDQQIGGRLRLWRRTMHIDGYALAERLGITYQQLQKYEKGMNRISAVRLFQIAGELNIPIDYFYHDAKMVRIGSTATANQAGVKNTEQYNLLMSGHGVDFLKSYASIKDPSVKKALIDLIRTIAADCGTTV